MKIILDLFAGPGGWDEGLRLLGVEAPVVGIDQDEAVCQTRSAAGHLTIRADVAKYPTSPFFNRVSGLIASPPCPTFSQAGRGSGRDSLPLLHRFAAQVHARGWDYAIDYPWCWGDPRTPLVLEPLRWVDALGPDWVAIEQVPDVIPLWGHYAAIWRDRGYSTWAGVLNAADYGVPQTRKRAFCLATREGVAGPPEPSHARGGGATLLGELQPWVSMAEALGWGALDVPVPTVTAGGTASGGPEPFARGGRALLERERERESLATEEREVPA